MFTSASTALTLLDSSAPDTRRTRASGSAVVPSFLRRIRPSWPLTSIDGGGLTSLMRSTVASADAFWPTGRMERVPSPPISIFSAGGIAIGPELPSTSRPSPVCNTPLAPRRRSPRRVYASVPSRARTAIQPSPLIAASSSRPVVVTAPGLRFTPGRSAMAKTRVGYPGPRTGMARNAARSARNPVVLIFARLCVFAACASSSCLAPDINT